MSHSTRTRYSAEFKRQAVARLEGCTNVTALAAELGIRRKFLYLWRDQFAQRGEAALQRGPGRPPQSPRLLAPPPPTAQERQLATLTERVALLERELGRKQLEVDFLAGTFAHVRGVMASRTKPGATPSTSGSTRDSRTKENG